MFQNMLSGKVALVTGASRGIGKGIAMSLAQAGATVYVTGRTERLGEAVVDLPGTIHATAAEIEHHGGKAVAVRCDHRDDDQVRAVFSRIQDEQGRLDILVNNAWSGYEGLNDGRDIPVDTPFWGKRLGFWDDNFMGVRAAYIASALAAPMMIAQGDGLIVHISFWIETPGNVAYAAAKIATDRLAVDMAAQFKTHNITVMSLYPGLVRTESILKFAQYFDMSNTESPEFVGLAIAALATDPHRMDKSGQALVVAQVALDYGYKDIDGAQPKPVHHVRPR